MSNFTEQFRTAMQQHGITPPAHIVGDGKPHSFDSEGNGGKKKGWYILHDCTVPFGIFGDWRRGTKHRWQADIGRELTADERATLKTEQAALRKQQELEEQDRYTKAIDKALTIMGHVQDADESFPYLVRKQVKPYDVFVYKNSLVVPMCDVEGYLQSLQFIPADGKDKKFLKGGRKKGCLHMIGEVQGVLCIAEGYATAATIHEATGHAVAVAFDAGNLGAVAQAMRDTYPDATIVLCADDDWQTGDNTGLTKAKETANAVGALYVAPTFGAERGEKDTDFNDMAAASGLDSVKQAIAAALAKVAVADVTPVTPNNTEGLGETAGAAEGVADVTGSGAGTKPVSEKQFGYVVYDNWRDGDGGRKLSPGVYYTKAAKDDEEPVQVWVCSPVHVDAITSDEQENNFGRLLRLRNSLGNWRKWPLPMEMLRGSGDEMRGELLAMGVEINPQAKDQLAVYLQSQHPARRVRCAVQLGWCKDVFVLPDSVFGANAAGVIYQSGERGTDEYTQGGTLEGWQTGVAARAAGNPVLAVSLAAAFAGALLKPCHAESGGIHWHGDSSTGKTTGIDAACSVWGGVKYRRSWRTTANGMEAVAALFNDGFLALDEISECEPSDVGAIVYALGNGRGKQRANRLGHARSVTRWACIIVSSGERTIGTTMSEGRCNTKAGQTVRLVDVPTLRKYGAWDNLHGFEHGAAFSDAVKQATAQHYGKAGRAFLERLTSDGRNFAEALEVIKAMPQFAARNGEGQEKRVAARFALIALAGELATEYCVTGWPQGMATDAAAEIFAVWRENRGGSGNDERRKILEQVADFIERNGDGRFDNVSGETQPRRDRAGWWEADEHGNRIYLFTAGGLREALDNKFELRRALPVLQQAGALPPPNASGERSHSRRINGQSVRVYIIAPDKLLHVATPATVAAAPDVTEKPLQTKDETSVTSATAPKTKASKLTKRGGHEAAVKATKPKGRKR